MHEAAMHEENCFVTLTYDDDHLPVDHSLDVSHFQLFMKRLRKANEGRRIRFFHCGEYGEGLHRPHYHALLFGYCPADCVLHTVRDGMQLFRSESLSSHWRMGFVTVGAVTFESAAYVSRYATKKVSGYEREDHYGLMHALTGEWYQVAPEYATMSRRPGIGATWFDKFQSDVYPSDELIVNGHITKPPRFYDSLAARVDPEGLETIKRARVSRARERSQDLTEDRLRAREKVQEAKFNFLKRGMEDET